MNPALRAFSSSCGELQPLALSLGLWALNKFVTKFWALLNFINIDEFRSCMCNIFKYTSSLGPSFPITNPVNWMKCGDYIMWIIYKKNPGFI